MVTTFVGATQAQAGVFDQMAAVANSALPAYGRVLSQSSHKNLEPAQIEAAIREAAALASDRVATKSAAGVLFEEQASLSSDLRRARKLATRLGHEESFEQLTQQINTAVTASIPATGELFKVAIDRVEFVKPQQLLTSHDTAATDYLRKHLSVQLQRQMRPLMSDLLEDVGAYATTAELAKHIEFGNMLNTIVEDYVLELCVDGFFNHLEHEEVVIRQDPDFRNTDLLQKVFG